MELMIYDFMEGLVWYKNSGMNMGLGENADIDAWTGWRFLTLTLWLTCRRT